MRVENFVKQENAWPVTDAYSGNDLLARSEWVWFEFWAGAPFDLKCEAKL